MKLYFVKFDFKGVYGVSGYVIRAKSKEEAIDKAIKQDSIEDDLIPQVKVYDSSNIPFDENGVFVLAWYYE